MRSLLLALALLLGCSPAPLQPERQGDCEAICHHLGEELRCPDFGPTPEGRPCTEWLCQSRGIKLGCLERARSCAEATDVQVRGCAAR